MSNKTILLAGVLVAVVFVGVYFYSKNTSANGSPQVMSDNVVESSQKEKSTVREFAVAGSNYKFEPNTITVKKGDTVKITFTNAEGFHDFVLDEFNVKTKKIGLGGKDSVQFVADKTGSFQYYCSVGKHRAMGMWGTLKVK